MRDTRFRALGEIQEGSPKYEDLLHTLKEIWETNTDITKLHFHHCGRGFTEFRIFDELREIRKPEQVRLSDIVNSFSNQAFQIWSDQTKILSLDHIEIQKKDETIPS